MTASLSTLTAADSIALEFYEENLNYVNGFGLTNLEREERRLFNHGKKVAARIVDAAVAMSKTRTPYTDEQVLFIAETYAACGGDRQTIVSAFANRFPLSGHSADSVDQKVCRFQVLDASRPDMVQWETDNQVRRIAQDFPQVFAAA